MDKYQLAIASALAAGMPEWDLKYLGDVKSKPDSYNRLSQKSKRRRLRQKLSRGYGR